MVTDTNRVGPRPTIWRMALLVGVYVAIGGGVVLLLGEPSIVPVMVALGIVTALGTRKRWKQATERSGA